MEASKENFIFNMYNVCVILKGSSLRMSLLYTLSYINWNIYITTLFGSIRLIVFYLYYVLWNFDTIWFNFHKVIEIFRNRLKDFWRTENKPSAIKK